MLTNDNFIFYILAEDIENLQTPYTYCSTPRIQVKLNIISLALVSFIVPANYSFVLFVDILP